MFYGTDFEHLAQKHGISVCHSHRFLVGDADCLLYTSIRMFKEQGLEAAILTSPVDKPFVSFLEYKNPGVKGQRIDADITDTLQEKTEGKESEAKKQADAFANTQM